MPEGETAGFGGMADGNTDVFGLMADFKTDVLGPPSYRVGRGSEALPDMAGRLVDVGRGGAGGRGQHGDDKGETCTGACAARRPLGSRRGSLLSYGHDV